jgi:hypothetical protein
MSLATPKGASMNVQDIWREAERKRIEYRTKGEEALLLEMLDRYQGLKELGWSDAVYCPKDGSTFLAIEAGSSGVFPCTYQGAWPDGKYWTEADGDLWPSRPILWKPLPANVMLEAVRRKGAGGIKG